MKGETPLSVVIPWSNRPELYTTLSANEREFTASRAEVIIVSNLCDCRTLSRILKRSHPSVTLLQVKKKDFVKSACMNIGASVANSSLLFFLDADISLPQGFLKTFVGDLGRRVFRTVRHVTDDKVDHYVRAANEEVAIQRVTFNIRVAGREGGATVPTARYDVNKHTRNGIGLLLVRRTHFLEIGGMNSDLRGWGFEDVDVALRLAYLLKLKHQECGWVIHHDDDRRATINRHVSHARNMSLALASYMAGQFSGTYHHDTATIGIKYLQRRRP
jgi:predicted glycosyltransferase involved in capsule biosynthesis